MFNLILIAFTLLFSCQAQSVAMTSNQQIKQNADLFTYSILVRQLTDHVSLFQKMFTEEGKIYAFDYERGHLVWVSDLGFRFKNYFQIGNPFIPVSQGKFVCDTYMVDFEEVEELLQKCQCLSEDFFVLKQEYMFIVDSNTGKSNILNQADLLSILNHPLKFGSRIIIKIEQKYTKYIVNTKTNGSYFNSKIKVSFMGRNAQAKSQSRVQVSKKNSNTVIVEYDASKFELQTEGNVIEIFGFDNQVFYSLIEDEQFYDQEQLVLIDYEKMNDSQEKNQFYPALIDSNEDRINQYNGDKINQYNEDRMNQIKECIVRLRESKQIVLQNQIKYDVIEFIDIKPIPMIVLILVVCMLQLLMYTPTKYNDQIEVQQFEEDIKTIEQQEVKQVVEQQVEQQKQTTPIPQIYQIFKDQILGVGQNGTIVYDGLYVGKSVAIKRIKTSIIDREDVMREIHIMMKMNHPHILHFYFHHEAKNHIDLVLERCSINLGQLVTQDIVTQGISSTQFLQKLTRQSLEALAHLQGEKVVHRDIKPENILVSQEGDIKLADFGISKIHSSKKNTKVPQVYITQIRTQEHTDGELERLSQRIGTLLSLMYSHSVAVYTIMLLRALMPIERGSLQLLINHYNSINQEGRVIDGRMEDIRKHIDDYLLSDLIRGMVQIEPEDRGYPSQLLKHPYFWTYIKKISLICDLSDYVETNGRNTIILLIDKNNCISITLDRYFYDAQVFKMQWNCLLDEELLSQAKRPYNYNSSKHLIRIFRNTRNHFNELTITSQNTLGRNDTQFFNYWNTRFPKLFYTCYKYCKDHNIRLFND